MSSVAPARERTLAALAEVRHGAPVSDALRNALDEGRLSAADRALTTQMVYGVLRHRRYLDAWIRPFMRGPLDPVVRDILRLGFFQLGFLDRVPTYAVVNEAVEQAKMLAPKAAPLVNAVLRRGLAARPQDLSLAEEYSHPDWLVERWRRRFGERVREILAADNQIPPLTLRVNRARATPEAVLAALAENGLAGQPSEFLPEAIRVTGALWLEDFAPFADGRVSVQDESGMLVAWIANPPPKSRVLDLTAGLGSKTTHLLEKYDDIQMTAVDASPDRLDLLRDNLARLGLEDRVEIVAQDARELARRRAGRYDTVILDAPCTGLGVLRRRVDARWRKEPKDLIEMSRLQQELFDAAFEAARPGGVIIYSTCSIEPEETVDIIQEGIKRHFGLVPESVAPLLPDSRLRSAVVNGMFMVLPGQWGMDGFFIARLRKKEGGESNVPDE